MNQQNPETPKPQPPHNTPAPASSNETPPATPEGKRPPWGDDANFNAEEAWKTIQNLRKEKGGGDSGLRSELEQMRKAQQEQRDTLASALGVKPEETSDSDKLAGQIEALRGQILASEKRALSAEFKVPENMLTAADADGLRAQATALAEFAQAAHYAASTAAGAGTPPAFASNPGQGRGNAPLSPEAQAAAEYEKYYPSPK